VIVKGMGVFNADNTATAAAGSIGSVLAISLVYPVDRVRVQLQIANTACKEDRSTPLGVCARMFKEGTLYKGLYSVTQTMAVSNFVFFYIAAVIKLAFQKARERRGRKPSYYEPLVASSVAGCLNMILTEPLWRANMIISTAKPNGEQLSNDVFATVAKLAQKDGVASLWIGLGTSLLLVSNPIIQFFAYDAVKEPIVRRRKRLTGSQAFLIGALAKTIATILTYPLQVAQSRLRMQKAKKDKAESNGDGPTPYQGVGDCMIRIAQQEGIAGLFAGMGPKLVATVLNAAFMFFFYEKIEYAIKKSMGRNKKLPQ